jgi:tetratricopeptide (TPR) repeat protein
VDLDPVSHQVAFHYERAGLLEQAARYYLLAARVARRIFANEEAINLLQRGLMLIKDDGCGVSGDEYRHEVAASLYEELGDTLELRAQFEGALQAYQNAQAQLLRADGVRQARLHRKVGAVFSEQRLFTEALDACHRAEIALGKQPDGDADPWWDEWLEVQVEQVWAHYWLAQWLEMDNLVRNAQPIVQKRGSGSSRMRFLVASCLMHLRRERYVVSDEMLSDSREALTLSREWGSLKARTECQFELGFLHLWRREFDEAEENLQAALELAENSGNLHFRILSLTYMTILYRFRDQEDNVREYAQHACEVAEAAHMPDYVAAAKSNLAWLAWHQGNLPEVEKKCRESLAIWRQSPLVYPFQWLALWPLIAVALIRGRDEEAYAHAQALIEPRQQHLPEKLNATLTAGLQAGVGAARPYLDLAVELAREMAYI